MAVTLRFSSNAASGVKSCGGAPMTGTAGIIPNTSALNAVFDKVLKHENISGSTEYRLVYLSNDSTSSEKIYNIKVKLLSTPDSEIAIGALAKNDIGTSLATEKQAPSSVVFKTQAELNSESAGYLSFSNAEELAPGEYVGLWMRRKVRSSGGSGTVKEELVLEVQYMN